MRIEWRYLHSIDFNWRQIEPSRIDCTWTFSNGILIINILLWPTENSVIYKYHKYPKTAKPKQTGKEINLLAAFIYFIYESSSQRHIATLCVVNIILNVFTSSFSQIKKKKKIIFELKWFMRTLCKCTWMMGWHSTGTYAHARMNETSKHTWNTVENIILAHTEKTSTAIN